MPPGCLRRWLHVTVFIGFLHVGGGKAGPFPGGFDGGFVIPYHTPVADLSDGGIIDDSLDGDGGLVVESDRRLKNVTFCVILVFGCLEMAAILAREYFEDCV